jgi:hypothetical protein
MEEEAGIRLHNALLTIESAEYIEEIKKIIAEHRALRGK